MLQIAPGFFKYKKKTFSCLKKIWNGPEQKLLDQKFLVLIENVLFRSRILFQKRIYSIFFGTKAPKRKLSILKERWFDIAIPDRTDLYIKNQKTHLTGMPLSIFNKIIPWHIHCPNCGRGFTPGRAHSKNAK
jgi:hypothetical protein